MARKKSTKKKISKKPSKAAAPISSLSAHHKKMEKVVIVGLLSIILIAFVVWFSQDFRSEGMAYHAQLELDNQKDNAIIAATICDSKEACQFVNDVANAGFDKISLNGKMVSTYELTFYNELGEEITEGFLQGQTSYLTLKNSGVETIGYKGIRYPVSAVKN